MNGFQFFYTLRAGAYLLLVFAVWLFVIGDTICEKIGQLMRFRRDYGENWRAEFEQVFGPVPRAYLQIGALCLGLLVSLGLMVWIVLLLNPRLGSSRRLKPRRSLRRHHRLSLEGRIAFRRKGLLRIYFGVPAIIAGAVLNVVGFGIFEDPANQQVLGLFVFGAGYLLIISGCSFWLRAKQWNEAIVMIGLLPIAVFFVPFVRLIFLYNPVLLFVTMFLMPLVLVTVVLTLPDRSTEGVSSKTAPKQWKEFLANGSQPGNVERPHRPSVLAQQKQQQRENLATVQTLRLS